MVFGVLIDQARVDKIVDDAGGDTAPQQIGAYSFVVSVGRTEAEIDAANDTDLPDLLASLGYQVQRVGSYYTTREMDSLRIKDRRIWFRNSENTGGDAIAFVQHFHGMSFPEAVRYLLAPPLH